MIIKRFLLVFTLLSLMCNIYADNLSVSDIKILAGKTGNISISLNNTSSKYTAFQFDLILPDGVTIAKDNDGKYLANLNEERIDDQKLTISDMGDNTYRFLTFSMKNSDFSGTEGELVNVTLQASSTIGVGTKKSTIEGAVFTRSDGTDTYFDEATFNVIVVSLEITPPIAKGELVYNGKAQELIEAGQTTFGKLLYSLDDSDYGNSIPTGTDAKKYTVYYKAVDDNEIDLTDPSSLEVTIAAKMVSSPTITLNPPSYTYDGNAKTPSVTVKDGETEIPSKEYTVGYKDNVEVGTATVTITDNEGGNYTVSGTATFAINAADGSVVAPTAKEGLVYNGKPQDLITAGSSTTGTMKYSLDGKAYDTAIPQGTDAKDYTVYYMVEGDANHNDIAAKTLTATIAAKTVNSPTIVLSKTSYTYDGNAKKPTVTVKDGETEIPSKEYTVGYKDNVEVGTATVTITDNEGGNYIVSGSASFIIEPVTKESIKITSAKQVAYYSNYALNFKSLPNLKAYVATGYDKTTGTIWLSRVYDVPAKTGFLLMGDEDTYEIPVSTTGSSSYYKNMFKGTLEGTTIYTTDGAYTNYYLSNGDDGVGFYKVNKEEGVKLGKNRAYLPIPTVINAVGEAGSTVAISVGGAEQVPYYSDQSLDFTEMAEKGMKAYTATGYDYATGTIWLSRVKQVPAETGVLIMAPKGDYDVPTVSVASVYENMFKGTLGGTTIYTEEEGFINYYLSNGAEGVGFYKVTKEEGVALGKNRCYLQIPKVNPSAASRGAEASQTAANLNSYSIGTSDVIGIPLFGSRGGNGEGTANICESVIAMESDVYYNLQGQRVDNPTKGLYIKNGRKVILR